MIKSPFTKTGDVRYLELFKITLVIALFVMVFSLALEQTVTLANTSIYGTAIVYILLMTELVVANLTTFATIVEYLKSTIVKLALEFYQEVRINITLIMTNIKEQLVPSNNSFRTLCVIRC